MAYEYGYQMQRHGGRGDPFLGFLAAGAAKLASPLIKKAGRWIGRQTLGGAIAKTAAGAGAVATTAAVLRPAPAMPGGMPINIGPIGINPGAALPGGDPFVTWGQRKRRKMNPLNPRALKRAVRRAEGFEKFAKKTVNALYKTSSCGCSKRTKKFKTSRGR